MKIGEFAKVCSAKISVLRHYDKEQLLVSEHTDLFLDTYIFSRNKI